MIMLRDMEDNYLNDLGLDDNLNDNEHVPTKLQDLLAALKKMYKIRRNVVKRRNEIMMKTEYEPLTAEIESKIYFDLDKNHRKTAHSDLKLALLHPEVATPFHPFKSYFDKFADYKPSDGDFIAQLCNCLTLADNAVMSYSDLRYYLETWLCGAYLTATEQGTHANPLCPILQGGQSIGKTRFINYLCPPELWQYYHAGANKFESKDDLIMICEKFIINLDEIESSTKGEKAALKSAITSVGTSFRRFQRPDAETERRRCSFMASVNEGDFLSDDTGNRRFPVAELVAIDLASLPNIHHVWRQAKYIADNGHNVGYLTAEQGLKVTAMAEKFRSASKEQELLQKWAYKGAEEDFKTTVEIAKEIAAKGEMPIANVSMWHVGKAMKLIGCTKRAARVNGKVVYGYDVKFRVLPAKEDSSEDLF